MLSSFIEFIRRASYIRGKLSAIRIENKLATKSLDSMGQGLCEELTEIHSFLKNSRARKKQYDYTLIIIAAYGAFENYIETIIEESIEIVSEIIPDFAQLPPQIRNKHTVLSFESIKNIKDVDRPRIESQTIANLHSCYADGERYKLNPSAFSYHTSNFRTETIREIFSKIGLDSICKRVLDDDEYSDYATNKLGAFNNANSKISESFQYIEDLADRRNEVAHGDFPQDLLSIDELELLVNSLEMFVRASTRAVQKHIASWCREHLSVELGIPIQCVNTNIACFTLPAQFTLRSDQLIFATKEDKLVAYGKIDEIQINKTKVGSLSAIGPVDIGLNLTIRAKPRHTYHIFKSNSHNLHNALEGLPATDIAN